MAIATGTALLASGALAAGATAYSASQARGAARDAQRNQLNPTDIARQSIDLQRQYAPTILGLEEQFRPAYADLNNRVTNQSLFGNSFFNAEAALAAMTPEARADIEAEAARTGYSPAEWLAGHTAEQAPRGDAVATSLRNDFGGTEGGLLDIYEGAAGRLGQIQAGANTAQRTADINDVENLGARASAAFRNANPDLAAATTSLQDRIAAARNVTPGANPAAQATMRDATAAQAATREATAANAAGSRLLPGLERDAARSLNRPTTLQAELERQAAAELATGGRLSPEAARDAEQAVRAASEARGLTLSNSSIFGEALNKESLTRQRQAEARQLAMGVDQAGVAARNANRSYALGVADRGTALDQFNAGQLTDTSRFNAAQGNATSQFNAGLATNTSLANAAQANAGSIFNAGQSNQMAQFNAELARARDNDQYGREFAMTGLLQSQAQDPYALVLGRSPALGAATGAVQQAGMGGGPQLFQTFDPTVSSIFNTNYNAGQAANLSAANNNAALTGAGISSLGSIFGSYLGSRSPGTGTGGGGTGQSFNFGAPGGIYGGPSSFEMWRPRGGG
jgi:hypothetical protein